MTDRPDALPADYDPAHVFRVVAMPVSQGWGIWLRAADDSIIHSFGLGFPPGTPFLPDVLNLLGPILAVQYGVAYHSEESWDAVEDHWSAVVYEVGAR